MRSPKANGLRNAVFETSSKYLVYKFSQDYFLLASLRKYVSCPVYTIILRVSDRAIVNVGCICRFCRIEFEDEYIILSL